MHDLHLLVADVGSGVITRIAPDVLFDGIVAVDPARGRAYARLRRPQGSRGVMAIEGPNGRVVWSKEGPEFFAVEGIAVVPGGDRVLVCYADIGGARGVALLHAATGDVAQFLPGVPCRGAVALAASALHPEGGFALAGRRDLTDQRSDSMFMLDLATRAVVDSFAVPGSGRTFGKVGSPDGRHLFFVTDESIWRYELQQKALTARVPTPAIGALALNASGDRVLLSDAGRGLDFPGAGVIHEFDLDLRVTRRIDLRQQLGGTDCLFWRVRFRPATGATSSSAQAQRNAAPCIRLSRSAFWSWTLRTGRSQRSFR